MFRSILLSLLLIGCAQSTNTSSGPIDISDIPVYQDAEFSKVVDVYKVGGKTIIEVDVKHNTAWTVGAYFRILNSSPWVIVENNTSSEGGTFITQKRPRKMTVEIQPVSEADSHVVQTIWREYN